VTTLITRNSATFATLTTEKGKEIGVGHGVEGMASIYIQRNGLSGLSMGRHFHAHTTEAALLKAVEAYKAADVKAALRALISDRI
jgi:hypothetical protein